MLKKSPEPQKAVKTCAVLILAIVSCIMPVTLINYVAGDDLILISSQGGVNFYIGNNEKSDGVSAVVPGTRSTWQGGYNDTINIAENEAGRKLKPSEVSRFWFKKGLAFILNQPKAALALYFKKLLFFLNYYEVSNNQDIYFFINFYGFLNLPVFISFWMVAPFAYVGILVNRKEPYWWLFTGFLIAQLFSFLLFFVCARFRVSFIPFLILFASAFIINKIDKIKRKKSYGFGMDGVISIMIFAFFLYSVCVQRPVYYNNMDNLSPGIYYLASRYFSKGNLEQSEKYFLKLTDYHEPYSSLSLMLLGFINFHKKNDDKALNYFSEAIKRDQNTWKDIENFLLDGKNRGKMILNKIKNAQ